MNIIKATTVILGIVFCCLYLCLTGSILASETVGKPETPIFEPGKEYHVKTSNRAIGTQSFNVFVPLDYTEDRSWPVIFRYKGRDSKYNPVICRAGRLNICDRGAIVVGMGYLKSPKKKMNSSEYKDYMKQELNSICEAKKIISKHLNLDDDRLFLSGTSAGGWLVSNLLEYNAQTWAGAMIFVAGRHPNASLLTSKESTKAFKAMPIFIGSTLPGDHHGTNYKYALKAKKLYTQRGAVVTFEKYGREGTVHTPLLRDWNRAFVLSGKTDSTRGKIIAKVKQFTRNKLKKTDSTEIIKTRIAEQLNKPVGELSADDLVRIKQLSLIGENVSDITYLAKLTNLESLDISFTYVNKIETLLNCKKLRKLNISGTYIENITPLKVLSQLELLSMWNLWLDREQVDELKAALPNLKIPDYQWDIYKTDSIGRVLPKLTVKLN